MQNTTIVDGNTILRYFINLAVHKCNSIRNYYWFVFNFFYVSRFKFHFFRSRQTYMLYRTDIHTYHVKLGFIFCFPVFNYIYCWIMKRTFWRSHSDVQKFYFTLIDYINFNHVWITNCINVCARNPNCLECFKSFHCYEIYRWIIDVKFYEILPINILILICNYLLHICDIYYRSNVRVLKPNRISVLNIQ